MFIRLYYRDISSKVKNFRQERRACCHTRSLELVERAKQDNPSGWIKDQRTVDAIIILLTCWNYRAAKTKKLSPIRIKQLLVNCTPILKQLENVNITTLNDNHEKVVCSLFDKFKKEFDQTGASKALSILNSKLFVMWDTEIRKKLRENNCKGIANGNTGINYWNFLKGIKWLIENRSALKSISVNEVTKRMDEYHYTSWVLNPKRKKKKTQ